MGVWWNCLLQANEQEFDQNRRLYRNRVIGLQETILLSRRAHEREAQRFLRRSIRDRLPLPVAGTLRRVLLLGWEVISDLLESSMPRACANGLRQAMLPRVKRPACLSCSSWAHQTYRSIEYNIHQPMVLQTLSTPRIPGMSQRYCKAAHYELIFEKHTS